MNDSKPISTTNTPPSTGYDLPEMDRTVIKSAKGSGTILAGKLFVFAAGFLTSFILARLLGAEQYGAYKLVLTVIYIGSSLTYLGLDLGLIRHVSLYLNRKDNDRIWGTFQLGVGIPTLLSLLASLIIFFGAEYIANTFFNDPNLASLLQFGSIFLPFLTLTTMFNATTKGFNSMLHMVVADRFSKSTVKLLLLGVFALFGLTVMKAITAFGLAELSAVLIYLYFINRLFPLRQPLQNGIRELRRIMRFSLPVYLSNTIQLFSNNIQTLLLGGMSTILNVGIFSLATQINAIGSLFHSSISGAAMPVVSTLFDRNDRAALGRYYQATTRWTFSLNLPLFLIIVTYPGTILSIFGQSFTEGTSALAILAWANLVNTGTGVSGVILDMTGHTGLKLANSIITVALTVILNLLLIPALGLVGVAVASLASVAAINILRLGEVYYMLKIIPYNLNFLKSIGAGGFAWLCSILLSRTLLPGTNLLSLALNGIVVTAVFLAAIFLLGLSREERVILTSFRKNIENRIAKRKE